MLARRASIELFYNGKNLTADISKYLESFSYTDNSSGVADDIAITLNDKNSEWINSWSPELGDKMQAKIIAENWYAEGDKHVLDCGAYVVDEPEYSGRPKTLTLKGISIPSNTNFKDVPKSRIWKKASIKKIAQTIADNNGIPLYFDTSFNPVITTIEQSEQSDMDFIQDLCKKNGLVLKVYNNKLVIFSEQEYEAKSAELTITEKMVKSWNFKKTLSDSGYDGCKLKYSKAKGQTISYEFYPPGSKKQKIYEMNESVDNHSEAEILVKSKLRELNKNQYTGSVDLLGDTKLLSGICVNIQGFGKFDGKYFVDKATHSLKGYNVSLELHKCLVGY